MLRGHKRIHLCGADTSVTEHFLNGSQVGAPFHHVRRCRVPQYVRREGTVSDPRTTAVSLDDLPQTLPREALPPCVEEQHIPALAFIQQGQPYREVAGDRISGKVTERDEPLLVAFAGHDHGSFLEFEIGQTDGDGLRRSCPCRVQEFEDGDVSEAERRRPVGSFDQPLHLPDRESLRKGACSPRPFDPVSYTHLPPHETDSY